MNCDACHQDGLDSTSSSSTSLPCGHRFHTLCLGKRFAQHAATPCPHSCPPGALLNFHTVSACLALWYQYVLLVIRDKLLTSERAVALLPATLRVRLNIQATREYERRFSSHLRSQIITAKDWQYAPAITVREAVVHLMKFTTGQEEKKLLNELGMSV